MNYTDTELIPHELCIDLWKNYNIEKEELKRFKTAFSIFHKTMTDINGQSVRNLLFLNENFLPLWNENDAEASFKKIVEEAVKMISLQKK